MPTPDEDLFLYPRSWIAIIKKLRRDVDLLMNNKGLRVISISEITPDLGDVIMPSCNDEPCPPRSLLPGAARSLEPSAPPAIILHDTIVGFIATGNFHHPSPNWSLINQSGLTSGEYLGANVLVVCPNGVIYTGHMGGPTDFVARAANVSSGFTVEKSQSDITAVFGGGTCRLTSMASKPDVGESFFFTLVKNGDELKVLSGSAGAYSTQYTGAYGGGTGSMSFGDEKWVLSLARWAFGPVSTNIVMNEACTAVLDQVDMTTIEYFYHVRAGVTGKTYHPRAGYMTIGTDNMDTVVHDDPVTGLVQAGLGVDSTGQHLMGNTGSGHIRSSDYGDTWSSFTIPFDSLPAQFVGLGDGKWLARTSVGIYYSPDNGDTWEDKQGDLDSVSPSRVLNLVSVL